MDRQSADQASSVPSFPAVPKRRRPWSDDRVALIARRWAEGATAAAIARELGTGVSRSAVIGKLHRLGVPPRETASARAGLSREQGRRSGRPRGQTGARARKLTLAFDALFEAAGLARFGDAHEAPAHPDAGKAFGTPCGLMELGPQTCRWPVGDPGTADFAFCGAVPLAARPYCAMHCLIAYRSPAPARAPHTRRRRLTRIFAPVADHAA